MAVCRGQRGLREQRCGHAAGTGWPLQRLGGRPPSIFLWDSPNHAGRGGNPKRGWNHRGPQCPLVIFKTTPSSREKVSPILRCLSRGTRVGGRHEPLEVPGLGLATQSPAHTARGPLGPAPSDQEPCGSALPTQSRQLPRQGCRNRLGSNLSRPLVWRFPGFLITTRQLDR